MDELDKRIERLEVLVFEMKARIGSLEREMSRSLNRAINAEVEIRALKESTHKVQFVNPQEYVDRASQDEDFDANSESRLNEMFDIQNEPPIADEELGWGQTEPTESPEQ